MYKDVFLYIDWGKTLINLKRIPVKPSIQIKKEVFRDNDL